MAEKEEAEPRQIIGKTIANVESVNDGTYCVITFTDGTAIEVRATPAASENTEPYFIFKESNNGSTSTYRG